MVLSHYFLHSRISLLASPNLFRSRILYFQFQLPLSAKRDINILGFRNEFQIKLNSTYKWRQSVFTIL
jgi:hypothetical protein